jgi:hypothetical protein
MNAVMKARFVGDIEQPGGLSPADGTDIDLLIELCDRLAIVTGKRWNAQFELRAAKPQ